MMATETHETLATAKCMSCGYSLRGLPSNICPECGSEFDPGDPLTYRHPQLREFTRSRRRLRNWQNAAASPTRVGCIVMSVATVYLIGATSNPAFLSHRDFNSTGAYLWRVFNVAMLAVVLFSSFAWVRSRFARQRILAHAPSLLPVENRYRRRLIAACMLLNLSLLLPWTLWLRFELSRTALERAARQQLITGSGTFESRWVGLYHVNGTFLHPNGAVLLDTLWVSHSHRQFVDRVGFFYLPPGTTSAYYWSRLSSEWAYGAW